MIFESVEHGSLIWPTIEENGVTRTKKYAELSAIEKIQADSCKGFAYYQLDQLDAYLEKHELHANEVRIMHERNQDPLALVANHQMTPPHFNTYQSSYNNPQFQQPFSLSQSPQYGSIHPAQHYLTSYQSTPLAISYLSTPYSTNTSTVNQQFIKIFILNHNLFLKLNIPSL
ncbi:hypothetical protein Tco_0021888 [Tanacetum coccineum]